HYHRTVNQKPAVIFLHGIVESGLCWERTVEILHSDYEVYLPDARGHGLSDSPSMGYAPEDHAEDVAALILHFDLDKPVLIGHSMGANTAAVVCAQFPGLVGGLILEDPPWWNKPTIEVDEMRRIMAERIRASVLKDYDNPLFEVITSIKERYPRWHADDYLNWAIAKKQVSLDILSGFYAPRCPWQQIASRIPCPTLLITGDPHLGAIVTPEVASEALSLIPQATQFHISGAGHNIRREKFETYTRAVQAFLSSVRWEHPSAFAAAAASRDELIQ
ncbi:MAG: alpha/beta hydrolase, partial [Anaerolineaceae bacterium]|nr:alpha/beta hydrolase [Anaerolineaceae bacterium]